MICQCGTELKVYNEELVQDEQGKEYCIYDLICPNLFDGGTHDKYIAGENDNEQQWTIKL